MTKQSLIFKQVYSHETEILKKIAQALFYEWNSLPRWSNKNTILERLKQRALPNNDELLFAVLSAENQLIATASIIKNELSVPNNAQFWLGEVLTIESARGRGIASKAVNELVKLYTQTHQQPLFLYTPDMQSLYHKLGWIAVQQFNTNNEDVTIMKRNFIISDF